MCKFTILYKLFIVVAKFTAYRYLAGKTVTILIPVKGDGNSNEAVLLFIVIAHFIVVDHFKRTPIETP